MDTKRYINEWVAVVGVTNREPDVEYLVHRYGVALTDLVVYEAYELDAGHSTITFRDSDTPCLGRVGTRDFTYGEYERAYRIIETAFPGVDGRRDTGRIERREPEVCEAA